MSQVLILIIKIYQLLISPFIGRNCRFCPSCSEFTIQAIKKTGIRGIFIGLKRLLHCHPFNAGGYDPIENWIKK